jgi:hypothetical protein
VAVIVSVWTEFTVPTGKRSEHPRGMALDTRMAALQAEQRRGNQWHSSSVNVCRKRAPYKERVDLIHFHPVAAGHAPVRCNVHWCWCGCTHQPVGVVSDRAGHTSGSPPFGCKWDVNVVPSHEGCDVIERGNSSKGQDAISECSFFPYILCELQAKSYTF